MKRTIRLTEGELRNLIKRSTYRVLREYGSDGPDFEDLMHHYLPDDDEEYYIENELDADDELHGEIPNNFNDEELEPEQLGRSHGVYDFKTPRVPKSEYPEILGGGVDDLANGIKTESRIRKIVRESLNRALRKKLYRR